MAIVKCSECGRAISDKASACVGCGAPLTPLPGFNVFPKQSTTPPLTRRQLRWRTALAASLLVLGVICASAADHRHGGNRLAATLAALLLISGLCWFVVTILQTVSARK